MPVDDINASGTETILSSFHDVSLAGTATQIRNIYDVNASGTASLIYPITLSTLYADLSGGPPTNSGSSSVNSNAWNLSNRRYVTLTLSRSDAYIYYWTSPYGVVYNMSRAAYLYFADGSTIGIGSSTNTRTVDIRGKSNSQKASVRLRGTISWDISTVTNSSFAGGWTVSNASVT